MKKQLSIAIACLLVMASLAVAQTTQSINLFTSGSTTQTSGTFNAGSNFSLDTYASFSGFTGRGLSYWLEVPTALAPYINISGENYFTWTDPNQAPVGSTTFISTTGADSGFNSENRDLGATSAFDPNTMMFTQDKPAGTYQVSTLTFSLDANAPAGTYNINTTVISPRQSEINDTTGGPGHNVNQSTYTLTVASTVPEPATWSLMGLGGLGTFGLTWLRARRRS